MIMKIKLYLILSFIGLSISCTNPKSSERVISYFDLKTFFENEIERLNKLNPSVQKIALNDNKRENKIFTKVDWEKELNIFIESDINKSAWKNSYSTASASDSSSETLTYKALEGSLSIRYISVKKDQHTQKVKEIEIRKVTINNLYRSTQVLKYFPDSTYYIIGKQKVRLMDENMYGVIGSFVH
jgi:hypothetical protein